MKGVELADVHELKIGFQESFNVAGFTSFQVEIDNAEPLRELRHQGKETRTEHMDSTKGKEMWSLLSLHLASLYVCPSTQLHVGFLKHKIAFSLALADKQHGIGVLRLIVEGGQVNIAEDVDIMNEDRCLRMEKWYCLLYASTCFEEHRAFIGDQNVDTEIVMFLQIIDNLFGEMMDIDNDSGETCLF